MMQEDERRPTRELPEGQLFSSPLYLQAPQDSDSGLYESSLRSQIISEKGLLFEGCTSIFWQ